jgi:hypothetical protein
MSLLADGQAKARSGANRTWSSLSESLPKVKKAVFRPFSCTTPLTILNTSRCFVRHQAVATFFFSRPITTSLRPQTRRMQGAFTAAEAACHDVLAAIASAREERHFVEQAERFQLALEDGEVVEEEGVKRNGAKKRGKGREKEPESAVVVVRPKRSRAHVAVDEEEEGAEPEKKERTRRGSRAVVAVVPPPAPPKKRALKSCDVARGPDNELVFYSGVQGKAVVECPVFGKDTVEAFRRDALAVCEFESLKDEEQQWVCAQLYDIYADQIKRARPKGTKDPLTNLMEVHSSLSDDKRCIFLTEHASNKGANPELLALMRNAGQLCANAEMFRDATYCMMTAKLHAELHKMSEYGALTAQFRLRLAEMCTLYEIGV